MNAHDDREFVHRDEVRSIDGSKLGLPIMKLKEFHLVDVCILDSLLTTTTPRPSVDLIKLNRVNRLRTWLVQPLR